MHRKGPRAVPDFSRHPARSDAAPKPDAAVKSPRSPAPRPAAAKPQATSSKSGRRGQ